MSYRSGFLICCWLWLGGMALFAQGTPADSVRLGYYRLGSFMQVTRRGYPAAIGYYEKMLALDEAGHRNAPRLDVFAVILTLYFYLADCPDAMKIALQGLALAESRGDTAQVARYNNILGFIYEKQGDNSQSALYYNLYLRWSETAGNSRAIADAF